MIQVMIVDDDSLIRRTLSSALARGGYGVCTASNGLRARQLAEVALPHIALVDLHMVNGGLELVRALKNRLGRRIYVAVLTGDDTTEVRDRCSAAGADIVLGKPVALIELRRTLAEAVRAMPNAPSP
jgi:CheY-like chemotaxis protein